MTTITRVTASLLVAFTTVPAQQPYQTSASPRQAGKTVAERLGYPASSRLLVIHADDFGMLHSVNRATIEALENKWITSASISCHARGFRRWLATRASIANGTSASTSP